MRINKPIAQSKVPPSANRLGRRQTNTEYDALAEKAKSLPMGKALPVQCEDKAEYLRLYQSLRNRAKKDKGLTVDARMRELTIYLSGSGDEKTGIAKNDRARVKASKKKTASKKKATTK